MSTQKNEQLPCPFMLSATVCHECGNPNKCDVYNESSRITPPTDTTGSGREGETPELVEAMERGRRAGVAASVIAEYSQHILSLERQRDAAIAQVEALRRLYHHYCQSNADTSRITTDLSGIIRSLEGLAAAYRAAGEGK